MSLNINELSWECIKPVIMQIRGKNSLIKSDVYLQLSNAQRALFSFHVYYNHAVKSIYEFYYWSVNFMEMNYYKEIMNSAGYFDDESFLSLLQLVEKEILSQKPNDKEQIDSIIQDNNFNELFFKFKGAGNNFVIKMGDHIRKNPHDFVIFED